MKKILVAMFFGILLGAQAQDTVKKSTDWEWCGWGGGGYFWSNAMHPTNPNIMYLGGDVVGIYKSTDHGKSWQFINNGLHEYGIYSMAISKSNPQVLYVMTPNGMARTDNGGEKWTPLPETLKAKRNLSAHRPGSVRAIAIDPTNPNTVYAGSAIGIASKSVDGGKTWINMDYLSAIKKDDSVPQVKPASGSGFLWASFKSPANDWKHAGRLEKYFNTVQDWSGQKALSASFFTPVGAPPLKVALVVQSGSDWKWEQSPFKDSKPGEWIDLSFDLSTLHDIKAVRMVHIAVISNGAEFNGEVGVDNVRLQPIDSTAKAVVLGEWDAAGSNEGWRTSKSGDAPFITSMRGSLAPATAEKNPIASIIVSDSNPNLIFICHSKLGTFRSQDAGKSWMLLDTPKSSMNLAVYPKNSKIIYGAFNAAGVWKSVDGGNSWKKFSNGLPEKSTMREILVNPKNPDIVHLIANGNWAGTYYRSTDGGKSWTGVRKFTRDLVGNPTNPDDAKGGTGELSSSTNIGLSPADPDTIFISANWNNILSTDGGITWQESSRGADITCFHDVRFVNDKVFAVAMDEGLLTSSDNGGTWSQLSPLRYASGESGHQWRVAAFQKENGEYHIVSTVSPWRGAAVYPNHVLVSDDSGKTFKHAVGLPDYLPKKNTMWGEGYARALSADPNNPLTMYLGIDGDAENGKSGGGVFKTTDGGYTWKQLENQPGTRRMFYGIAVDPTDSNRIFWGGFGANGGVWRSEDAGASWARMNGPDAYLFNVEVTNDGTVYAGGNELWKSTDHGTSWKKISNIEGRKGSVVGIAFDPENANRIWFSSVTWGGSSAGGIYRSDDGGKTWTDICGDISYRKIEICVR
jgi:photosystem II stability/assembly factor-like uncharacterized protein